MGDQQKKRVHAEFYKTEAGNEPVRNELKELGRPIKSLVGEDLAFIEMNWRLDRPYVDLLRKAQSDADASIYEARHKIENEQYRTLFFVSDDKMVLVSFFHKKSQKTPQHEIELAYERMKKWMKAEREVKKLRRR